MINGKDQKGQTQPPHLSCATFLLTLTVLYHHSLKLGLRIECGGGESADAIRFFERANLKISNFISFRRKELQMLFNLSQI